MVRSTSRFVLAASLPLLAACGDDPADPGVPNPPAPDPDVVSVTVVDTAGPIFRSVVVALDDSATLEIFYTPTAGGRVLRVTSDVRSTSHDVLIPRLAPDRSYDFAIVARAGAVVSDSIWRGTMETGPLPDELAAFDYSVSGTSTFPVLMVPFRSTSLGWAGQVGIDSDGDVVWYMESVGGTLVAHPVPGTFDMIFIENGFPNDGGRNGIVRVTPEREVVGLLERDAGTFGQIHHDATAVDSERVLFIAYDTRTVRDTVVNGEAVWEWNTRTGAVTQKWSSWDFIDWDTERDPAAAPSGWLHANSISVGPRGNTVLSFRTLNQVISIAPDWASIEWRIGGPNATHALAVADRFLGQHAAWELPGNRVLLFDNRGAGPDDNRSRGLELEMGADSAWMVWQHDPEPPISAPLRGGVYRLPSGNTVTVFPTLPFAVHETTPAGQIVWSMTGDQSFTSTFRVTPWESIAGEVEVAAMP